MDETRRPASLKNQIMWGVLWIMTPALLIIGSLGVLIGGGIVWDQINNEIRTATGFIALGVQTFQEQAYLAIKALEADLQPQEADKTAPPAFSFGPGTRALFTSQPHVLSALLISGAGRVIDSYPPDSSILGNDVSLQPYFTQARLTPWWSDSFVDLRSGYAAISVSQTLVVDNQPFTIVAFIRLDPLQASMTNATQRRGTNLSISDRFGTVIAHSDLGVVRRREQSPYYREGQRVQAVFTTGADGSSIYLWNVSLGTTGWTLHMTVPSKQLFDPLSNYVSLMLGSGLLTLAAAALLTSFRVRTLLRQLDEITGAAKLLGYGDFRVLDIPPEPLEFKTLAEVYNTMVDNLSQREHHIIELNRNLESTVQQRTQEVINQNSRLQKTLEELEQAQTELIQADRYATVAKLVAGIAHEINTPLGVALTASTYIEDAVRKLRHEQEDGNLTRTRFEDFLGTINESGQIINRNLDRAAHLIQTFKQLAVDQNLDLEREIRLQEHVNDLMESLRPSWKHRPITVEWTVEDLVIHSHPSAYSQILTNLVMNSLVHGFEIESPGRIDLEVHGDQDRAGWFWIDYRDSGRGMDQDTQTHIFEPFYTTKRQNGSTGLGMNIVYNLVTSKLGGTVQLESSPGAGVRFLIHLPRALPT